jgi:hypothetical protein
MVSEKRMQLATIAAMIVGSVFLGLILDSRSVLYALAGITLVLSGLYGFLAFRGKLPNYPAIAHAAPSFFVWTLFAALFAMSMLQVISVWIVILISVFVSALVGFLWPWKSSDERRVFSILLGALSFEWFLVLQFATANYMVLGALMTIAYTTTALLFEFQNEESVERADFVRHIVIAIALAFVFILGFTWTL